MDLCATESQTKRSSAVASPQENIEFHKADDPTGVIQRSTIRTLELSNTMRGIEEMHTAIASLLP
jgi:hypothetical protein